MRICEGKGCNSLALNDDPDERFCDVCFYKIPLLDLLAIIHGDEGRYTNVYGVSVSAKDAIHIIGKIRSALEIELMHHAHPVTKGETT